MKKIETKLSIILIILEFITCYEIAKFTSPIVFLSILIMFVVINIILVDMNNIE